MNEDGILYCEALGNLNSFKNYPLEGNSPRGHHGRFSAEMCKAGVNAWETYRSELALEMQETWPDTSPENEAVKAFFQFQYNEAAFIPEEDGNVTLIFPLYNKRGEFYRCSLPAFIIQEQLCGALEESGKMLELYERKGTKDILVDGLTREMLEAIHNENIANCEKAMEMLDLEFDFYDDEQAEEINLKAESGDICAPGGGNDTDNDTRFFQLKVFSLS
ncbi:MAG: hypothetical protein JWM96_536 [Alphaproteobacteria bacterium]|nr:hypothetical protein [Alphaproteobacteria bacterium]